MSANMSPPMPVDPGSTSPWTNQAASAASTAFPTSPEHAHACFRRERVSRCDHPVVRHDDGPPRAPLGIEAAAERAARQYENDQARDASHRITTPVWCPAAGCAAG